MPGTRVGNIDDADASSAPAREFGQDLSVAGLRNLLDGFGTLLNARLPRFGKLITSIPISPDTPATVDVLVPEGPGPHPVLVYLHGGAWVAGSPASHRKLTARFAEQGLLVVSVDYRLAPEHPFPGGLDDCVAAVRWATANVHRYGGDPARLALGGDSAGANLTAATLNVLAERLAAPRIAAALLIYGVFDMADLGGPSVSRLLHGAYLPGMPESVLSEPRVSPIHGVGALPPSFVVVGTQDVLLAQNRRFREALIDADRPHVYVEARHMPHGFLQMETLGEARRLVADMAAFLHGHLAESRATRWRGALMGCGRALQRLRRWPQQNRTVPTP